MLINIENISFDSSIKVNNRLFVAQIYGLSCQLESGKSYQLTSIQESNAWAACWLIGGAIPPNNGNIIIDGKLCEISQLRHNSWLVRIDEIKRYGLFSQSVKKQIRRGIRQNQELSMSEMDFMKTFQLTPQRYNRLLRQFSTEGWRASCAVGLANGKRIFCFPPLDTRFIEEHKERWFKEMIGFLKSKDRLILLPTISSVDLTGICDGVIEVTN